MNQTIIVSVIIPTFNRSKLLAETLLSVKNQSFKNWECLIVDDGSEDNTSQIINSFLKKDSRYKYYQRPSGYPKGASGCRNYGFEKSIGKYIQWLDDDDLLSKNKLLLQVKRLEKMSDLRVFTTCDWDLLWPGKNIEFKNSFTVKEYYEPFEFFELLGKNQTFVPIHSYLFPKSLILKSGIWNTLIRLNDDAEFISRIIVNSKKIINTEDCYVLYREHSGTRISKEKDVNNLQSLILSLKLMHSSLKENNIENKVYFKWKLLKAFHQHWKTNPEILKANFSFFKEHGINLNYANYYLLRNIIYQKLYPWYKRYIKKQTP